MPQNLETQLKVTAFLRDSYHLDEAIGVCKLAIPASPEKADIRFKIARSYLAIGKFDDAITHF